MKVFAETASPLVLKMLSRTFALNGVLTTPSAIAASGREPLEVLEGLESALDSEQLLILPAVSMQYSDMLEEVTVLQNSFDEAMIQIPAIKDGFQVLLQSRKLDLNLCVSGCFNAMQAYFGAANGAKAVLFYLNQMENQTDGLAEIARCRDIFDQAQLECQIFVGSFRNLNQVEDVMALGVDGVVVNPDLLSQCESNVNTRFAFASFQSDWQKIYGRTTFFTKPDEEGLRSDMQSLADQSGTNENKDGD